MASVATAEMSGRLLSRSYRARLLTVLLLASILNFMDRAILSAVIEPMRLELGLTDGQIGLLQGLAFGIIYSLATLPISRLAERASRVVVLACSVTFFSIMSALCGLANGFAQLFGLRAGVGIGEAAFLPPAVSLISDHYPATRRASALSIINLGSPIGYLIGSAGGGWVAGMFGWREAFLVTAIPGFFVALLLITLLREPPRGLSEGAAPSSEPAPPFKAVLRELFARPAFKHLLFGGTLCLFGSYGISQFQYPYFVRAHGLSLQEAGLVVGMISFLSIGGGSLLGGFGTDWAERFDRRWYARMPAIGVLLAGIFFSLGFLSENLKLCVTGLMIGGIALFCFYAPTYAMVQNMVGPRMRASAVGLLATTFGLIGAGLGPTALGFESDAFAALAFHGGDYRLICQGGADIAAQGSATATACAAASAAGIRYALAGTGFFFAWASVHFWLASRTIVADMSFMKASRPD